MTVIKNDNLFLKSLADEVVSKFRRLDSLVSHNPSRGVYHESIIRDLLRDYLPSSYDVNQGFIVKLGDSMISSQTDVIILDTSDPRAYGFKSKDFIIGADISVCMFGEIKTSVTKSQFRTAFEKSIKTSEVHNRAADVMPTSFIFVFDIKADSILFATWLRELAEEASKKGVVYANMPDYIFCFEKGFVFHKDPDGSRKRYLVTESDKGDSARQKMLSQLVLGAVDGALRQKEATR